MIRELVFFRINQHGQWNGGKDKMLFVFFLSGWTNQRAVNHDISCHTIRQVATELRKYSTSWFVNRFYTFTSRYISAFHHSTFRLPMENIFCIKPKPLSFNCCFFGDTHVYEWNEIWFIGCIQREICQMWRDIQSAFYITERVHRHSCFADVCVTYKLRIVMDRIKMKRLGFA